MQKVDEFMEKLLEEKGVITPSPEIRAEVIADMRKKLVAEVNRAAILSLSEEKAAELTKLINQPDFSDQKMTDFMQNSGVDLEKIVKDTCSKFRDFYLGKEEK